MQTSMKNMWRRWHHAYRMRAMMDAGYSYEEMMSLYRDNFDKMPAVVQRKMEEKLASGMWPNGVVNLG